MKRLDMIRKLSAAGKTKINGKNVALCKNTELVKALAELDTKVFADDTIGDKITHNKDTVGDTVIMRKPKADTVRFVYGIDVWGKEEFEVPREKVRWLKEFGYKVVGEG